MLGKKHSLTLLISVARCRCNLSHGNDNIPRTKLIHQCRCKTSLHIHDYIIYLTNYLFNLVFACALVSLFVLLIWIILVTWHRYFAYTTNIHIYIYTLYMCVHICLAVTVSHHAAYAQHGNRITFCLRRAPCQGRLFI